MAIDLGDIPSGTPPTAGEKLQIRSAIGVGTTDAPTFLAQSLTGQNLTGTQATSLVDLATTWLSTTGTPTAIKLNVTDTASNAASLFMDLQVGGVSKLSIKKDGTLTTVGSVTAGALNVGTAMLMSQTGGHIRASNGTAINIGAADSSSTDNFANLFLRSSAVISFGGDAKLYSDASGILAQRNASAAQAFRVYNTLPTGSPTAGEWLEIDWQTAPLNTVKIGTNKGVAGTRRSMNFCLEGAAYFGLGVGGGSSGAWWSIASSGHILCDVNNAYDIGASGGNKPRNIYAGTNIRGLTLQVDGGAGTGTFFSNAVGADGVVRISDFAGTSFGRLQLGGTTSAFPAIKRNGTGIDIRLADDSAFAPVKGKITTDTNYTVGVPSATGYLTIYDATGTAYRVPCTV